MSVTRRSFVRHTLALGPLAMTFWIETDSALAQDPQCTLPNGGPGTRFIPNEPKVVTRFSAREMAAPAKAAQLKQLRDAFCKIRALPSADVIGWDKEIAQHCINCKSANPNNIHYSSAFLPWHRGLLYFLERILRNLSGVDDLRLVYWDWESPLSRNLPTIYAPKLAPPPATNPNCLFWQNRRTTGTNWPLPNNFVDVQPLLIIPAFKTFGGGAQGQTGAAFGGPHANVHNNFAPGDMANLMFSPRDPVFYAHHGNIDRLWSSWVKAGHPNPDFGDAKAFFYDENRQWRFIMFNDVRDETKLGYKYSSLMQPAAPLNKLQSFSLTASASQFNLAPDAMNQVQKAAGRRFLIIENIGNLDKLPAGTLNFGIFSDNPPVGTQSATLKGFLGRVATVNSSDADHQHTGPLTAAFEVTTKLPTLLKSNKGTFNLTVAPLDASGKTTGPGIPLTSESVSIIG